MTVLLGTFSLPAHPESNPHPSLAIFAESDFEACRPFIELDIRCKCILMFLHVEIDRVICDHGSRSRLVLEPIAARRRQNLSNAIAWSSLDRCYQALVAKALLSN